MADIERTSIADNLDDGEILQIKQDIIDDVHDKMKWDSEFLEKKHEIQGPHIISREYCYHSRCNGWNTCICMYKFRLPSAKNKDGSRKYILDEQCTNAMIAMLQDLRWGEQLKSQRFHDAYRQHKVIQIIMSIKDKNLVCGNTEMSRLKFISLCYQIREHLS